MLAIQRLKGVLMDIVLRKELNFLDDIQKASSGWTRNYDYSNLCKPSKILGY